jgi:hypothetical protein
MKVWELMEELRRFARQDNICVEMTQADVRRFVDADDLSTNFDVASLERENTGRHSVKITLGNDDQSGA